MTKDLIERLEARLRLAEQHGPICEGREVYIPSSWLPALLASLTGEGEPVAQDAKDAEITRLRADITALEDGNMTFLCDQLDKAKAENAAQAVELERMRDLVGDLDRRAKACEGLKPKAHDGPSHHRLGGKAQAYAHAADLARQALKAG